MRSSVNEYPSVVMETGRAVELVAFSACMFTLRPVAFLATCAFATRVQVQYATSTQRLGTSALSVRFGFLFGDLCFETGCYRTHRPVAYPLADLLQCPSCRFHGSSLHAESYCCDILSKRCKFFSLFVFLSATQYATRVQVSAQRLGTPALSERLVTCSVIYDWNSDTLALSSCYVTSC